MQSLVIVAIVAAIPVILILLLRVNAGLVFLSACAGTLIAKYFGQDVETFARGFIAQPGVSLLSSTRLLLIILPVLVTIIALRRTVAGAQHLINLIVALATGLSLIFLAFPYLSSGTAGTIRQVPFWSTAEQMQGTIIGATAFLSLIMLWSLRALKHPKKDKKKRHR